jgi:alpha/beta superfamily hydrolase
MDETEIERLRKVIRHSYSNAPHKKKYWLALFDMYAKGVTNAAETVDHPECVVIGRAAVNPSRSASHRSPKPVTASEDCACDADDG